MPLNADQVPGAQRTARRGGGSAGEIRVLFAGNACVLGIVKYTTRRSLIFEVISQILNFELISAVFEAKIFSILAI